MKREARSGFTLTEVLIATSIIAVAMTVAYSAIIQLSRGAASVANYTELNQKTRVVLEQFGRDIRMGKNVTAVSDNGITMTTQGPTSEVNVIYQYVPNTKTLFRTEEGTTRRMMWDIEEFKFVFYNILKQETTNPLEVKEVQLEATAQRKVSQATNTQYIISAKYVMRNRVVAQ